MKIIAGVIIKQNDKYLLVQEGQGAAKNLWIFPAGGIDKGEKPEEAAVREAKEEAGIQVKIIRPIGTFNGFGPEETEFIIFEAEIVSGSPRPGKEISDVRWFSFEELKNMSDQLRGDWTLKAIEMMK
jgi:8-oxo-dGTP diphosphatase